MAKLMLKFKPTQKEAEGRTEIREMSEFLGFDERTGALVYKDEKGKPHYVFADVLEEFVLPDKLAKHNHNH